MQIRRSSQQQPETLRAYYAAVATETQRSSLPKIAAVMLALLDEREAHDPDRAVWATTARRGDASDALRLGLSAADTPQPAVWVWVVARTYVVAVPLISADPAWQGTTIEGAAASPAVARALILAGLDYVSRIGNA